VEFGLERATILLLGEQEFDHLGGAWQATGMCCENPIATALHVASISTDHVRLGASRGQKPTGIMLAFRRAGKPATAFSPHRRRRGAGCALGRSWSASGHARMNFTPRSALCVALNAVAGGNTPARPRREQY